MNEYDPPPKKVLPLDYAGPLPKQRPSYPTNLDPVGQFAACWTLLMGTEFRSSGFRHLCPHFQVNACSITHLSSRWPQRVSVMVWAYLARKPANCLRLRYRILLVASIFGLLDHRA